MGWINFKTFVKKLLQKPKECITVNERLDMIDEVANDIAIGVKESAGKFEIVVVKYNVETGYAKIESVEKCESKSDASNRFKVLAVDLKLVV